jgi:hypothetical protein
MYHRTGEKFRCLLELAAGFEQPMIWAENSAIGPAENVAALITITVNALRGRMRT